MQDTKSILQMARGAFQERVDLEMAKVIDNILDPNTKPTQKPVLEEATTDAVRRVDEAEEAVTE